MNDVYVYDCVRTPRGKARPGGGLADVTPLAMLEGLLGALAERTGVTMADDLIVGCATQHGEQGGNLARTAALTSGFEAPGMTVNRYCTSGIDAVRTAAALVSSGACRTVVAGGVESVSRVPMFSDRGPLWSLPVGSIHMGVAADTVATLEGYTRSELDLYGLRTQTLAASAWAGGRYDRSLVLLNGLERDEHVRPGLTIEAFAGMEPAFAGTPAQDAVVLKHLPELSEIRHLHTRGTSPSLCDAAGLVLVGTDLDLAPLARVVGGATAVSDPVTMLTAGQRAVTQVLVGAGLSADEVEVFEFAEAFAALCLKFQRDLGVGDDRFNVNGGTIAMGHAFGATGAILIAACVDELHRRGARYGVAAVSGAAGSGSAVLLERV
ncbi:acetyl-CoA C-acyltransferase [Nonomuraea sediminis]|uniref:acetyl-CoA C-acyltransferase n=1 Tax=Nonomuraea sediminis TaxID=2835864 RepID=UPI001BDD2015|nr:acetyl-CoA C-acyltransferase [Nonomuraea sediminis]